MLTNDQVLALYTEILCSFHTYSRDDEFEEFASNILTCLQRLQEDDDDDTEEVQSYRDGYCNGWRDNCNARIEEFKKDLQQESHPLLQEYIQKRIEITEASYNATRDPGRRL